MALIACEFVQVTLLYFSHQQKRIITLALDFSLFLLVKIPSFDLIQIQGGFY